VVGGGLKQRELGINSHWELFLVGLRTKEVRTQIPMGIVIGGRNKWIYYSNPDGICSSWKQQRKLVFNSR